MDLIKIEKRVPGTLLLKFQDLHNFQNKIDIAIEYNQDFRMLPLELVAGMFQVDSTLQAYRNGLWTMPQEHKEKVFKFAKEKGLFYTGDGNEVTQPELLYSEAQLRQALKMGRVKIIQDIIASKNIPQKIMLASLAREEVDSLTQRVIDLIEGGLGTSIVDGVE